MTSFASRFSLLATLLSFALCASCQQTYYFSKANPGVQQGRTLVIQYAFPDLNQQVDNTMGWSMFVAVQQPTFFDNSRSQLGGIEITVGNSPWPITGGSGCDVGINKNLWGQPNLVCGPYTITGELLWFQFWYNSSLSGQILGPGITISCLSAPGCCGLETCNFGQISAYFVASGPSIHGTNHWGECAVDNGPLQSQATHVQTAESLTN